MQNFGARSNVTTKARLECHTTAHPFAHSSSTYLLVWLDILQLFQEPGCDHHQLVTYTITSSLECHLNSNFNILRRCSYAGGRFERTQSIFLSPDNNRYLWLMYMYCMCVEYYEIMLIYCIILTENYPILWFINNNFLIYLTPFRSNDYFSLISTGWQRNKGQLFDDQ
jgi:hypothetical protein